MEFMESSLGRKCVPMRSDMEWAAESLCVPARSGRLTLASGWGCGSETEAWRLGSGSHTAERGRMAEDVSLMPLSCLRPFILSFSLEKGERGFSFMERSNMLAVMLFLMNWMLTWMRPRSFFFFPGLDSKGYQLQRERRGNSRRGTSTRQFMQREQTLWKISKLDYRTFNTMQIHIKYTQKKVDNGVKVQRLLKNDTYKKGN